jgi:uncharacterized protein (DUF924 family)
VFDPPHARAYLARHGVQCTGRLRHGWVSVLDPEELLAFWFGDAVSEPASAASRMRLWFAPDAGVDAELGRRFAAVTAEAATGGLLDWEDAPRPCLALVLALDQLPRNLYRRTARAFASDAAALAVAARARRRGHLAALAPIEQAFLLLPYQHVEDRALQRQGVALYEELATGAPPPWRPLLADFLDYARRHLRLIERFGRFPHRNAILGRPSTDEESRYLSSEGETFGQG